MIEHFLTEYDSEVKNLGKRSDSSGRLERLSCEMKSTELLTVGILLRDLRGIWGDANVALRGHGNLVSPRLVGG